MIKSNHFFNVIFMIAIISLFISCSSSENKFIGTWEHSEKLWNGLVGRERLVITKEGSKFMIEYQEQKVGGNFDTQLKSVSDYKDGKLMLSTGMGMEDITISDDSKKIYWAGKEFLYLLSNSDPDYQTEIDSRNKSKNDSENLTLTFDSYSEGDYPHLLFVDNSSKKQYDFRSLNENNLCGIPILLDDNQSSFGFKANPEYLNKSFIVECKKNSIKGLDLEGNTIIDEVWIITNLKVK